MQNETGSGCQGNQMGDKKKKLHELTILRLSSNWIRLGVLAVDVEELGI